MKKELLILLFVLLGIGTYSQSSQGPNNPATATNIGDPYSAPWQNAGNILSSNNAYAYVNLDYFSMYQADQGSNFLNASGFNFSIPAGAIINGVVVQVERMAAVPGVVFDGYLELVSGSSSISNPKINSGAWSNSDEVVAYGSGVDNWGASLTADIVNSSGFGVRLCCSVSDENTSTAYVDNITIKIYYTYTPGPSAGVAITSDGSVADPSALLELKSINQGFLLPRMSTSQKNSIASPKPGLLVYDNNSNNICYYNGSGWASPSTGAGTGTVTSIATGTGLSGGTITSSGTISMANMGAYSIKGNGTSVTAAPADIVVSANSVLGRNSGNISSIPFGTGAGTVAAGNHTHSAAGSDQQVIYNNGGAYAGNGNYRWNNNYKVVQLGNLPAASVYNPWSGLPGLNIGNYGSYSGGTTCGLANVTMSSNLGFDNGRSNNFYFFRSKDETNTGGAAGRVSSGDCLGNFEWFGWNYFSDGMFGSSWGHQYGAEIRVFVDGTVADDVMPATMSIGVTKDIYFTAGTAERMRIVGSTGNVGIGTNNPGTYKLYVAGNAWSTGTWGSSDERWKKNIQPIQQALQKITALRGVTYEWRTEEFPKRGFDKGVHYGLIAQQVEKVIPELVKTDTDGYKAVSYDKLTAILIEAVKEQQKEIEMLKAEVEKLKTKN